MCNSCGLDVVLIFLRKFSIMRGKCILIDGDAFVLSNFDGVDGGEARECC